MSDTLTRRLGAIPTTSGARLTVWSPEASSVELILERDEATLPLRNDGTGYFTLETERLRTGDRYRLLLNGESTFPDPASRFQPEGVHGPSEVVDPRDYRWNDAEWDGIPLEEMVIYELHVGTFTPEGTFDAARERLEYLSELGVNTIELMPVADFPGARNWGYDHAAMYAPSRAYGLPDDLRRLVDEAHRLGMAVVLDVIYNHFGPDGAYAAAFAPFFTDRHHTPWGMAMNLDDEHSEGVRNFFIDNALHWLIEYHIDGLRLDATHAMIDDSEMHFLAELSRAVERVPDGPPRMLIAEDHRNLNRLLLPVDRDGYGIDAVWADDFHHQMRNRTAGDEEAYFADYRDTTLDDLARTINRGWHFDGTREPVTERDPGTDPTGLWPEQFVFCIQNHDQVGNRPLGDRLTDAIDLHTFRAASALLLFLPQTPMLFMGQEWAASTPFLFFTDHNDELGRAVTKGRREEFKDFTGFAGEVPDPQAKDSFTRSRLDWREAEREPHRSMLTFYRDLIARRGALDGLAEAHAEDDAVLVVARGEMTLYVAFEAGRACDVVADAIAWHSEQAEYGGAADSAPVIRDGRLHFPVPAAALVHHPPTAR